MHLSPKIPLKISGNIYLIMFILISSLLYSCTKETLKPQRSRLVKYTYTYSNDTTTQYYVLIAYDNNGRISERYWYLDNKITAFEYYKYILDSKNNLKQILYSDNSNDQYTYNIGDYGYVSNMIDNSSNSVKNYTYDLNNYVLKSTKAGDNYTYTYSNGNCIQMTDTYLSTSNQTVSCTRKCTYDNNILGTFAQPIIFTIDIDTWDLRPVNFYGTNNKNYLSHISDVYKFSDGSEIDETCDIKYKIDENQNITNVTLSFTKTDAENWSVFINLYYENY